MSPLFPNKQLPISGAPHLYLVLLCNCCCINLSAFNRSHESELKQLYSFKPIQELRVPLVTLEKSVAETRKKLLEIIKKEEKGLSSLFKKK